MFQVTGLNRRLNEPYVPCDEHGRKFLQELWMLWRARRRCLLRCPSYWKVVSVAGALPSDSLEFSVDTEKANLHFK